MFTPVLLLAPLLCATAPEAPTRVELVFGGDVIPHGEVKKAAQAHALIAPPVKKGEPPRSLNNEGWDHVFAPIADSLRSADVAVVNLETPVTDNKKAVSRPFVFNAPSAMVRALADAGVKLVSTANNHARDQHMEGLVETLRHLDAAGIQHVGTGVSLSPAWEPVFMEVKGIRLGFLSFTRWLNGFANPADLEQPHVAYVPYPPEEQLRDVTVEQVVEQVRMAAEQCDVLFVLVHWGTEYAEKPLPEDQALARALLEAGAGAVIGHHPHVLQPLEHYTTTAGRKGLIAYSLGNLVANQGRFYTYKPGTTGKEGDVRDSMLLRVAWVRREPGGPVELDAVSVLPLWIENNMRTRKGKEPRNIQPLVIDRELSAGVERVALMDAQPAPASRKAKAAAKLERALLERRLAMQKLRRERILRMLPEGVTVAEPPPPPAAEAGGSTGLQGAP